MAVRSPVTAMPVLGGRSPGVTVTVRSDEPPLATVAGTARPVPTGGIPCELRGGGAPVTKSALLLLVSIEPPPRRIAAVVLLGAGVGPAPSKQFAEPPNPTKSTLDA